MLDLKFVREHQEEVEQALKNRGQEISLDEYRGREAERRQLLTRLEELRHERNTLSKEVGALMQAGKRDEAQVSKARAALINASIKNLEDQAEAQDSWVRDFLLNLPNIPHESVPLGASSDDNPVVRTWGEAPRFDFPPKAHWDIGENLGILDFERAAKITGARFALLKGAGALLERALINFMLDLHTRKHGYTEVLPPFIVNADSLRGTGQLPKFQEDLFKLEGLNYFLAPTAEVPVTNIHRDEILPAEDLPLCYTAYTPCFRSEAGSYGKDVRGLIRQHQFNKVELVKFTLPENSYRGVGTSAARCGRSVAGVGPALPGGGPVHRGYGLCRGQNLRHRGLAARAGSLPGNLVVQQLRKLPGPPGVHPLPPPRGQGHRTGPHPERLRPGGGPHPGSHPGKLPAG